MKLGLLTFNIAKDWELDTLLAKAGELGFEGVELRTGRGHAHGAEMDTPTAKLAEIRARCAEAGIRIAGLSSSCSYDSPDEEVLRSNIADTKRHLEMCCELGTGGVKVYGNVFHDEEGIPRAQTMRQVSESLAECADFAADRGVKVRFEMHGHFTTPELCLEALSLANPEGIGLIFNCNQPDVVDGSVAETYRAVADRVIHVHLHDLGAPDFPYQELVGLLAADGYQGWCSAELQESAEPDRLLQFYVALWRAYVRLASVARI